MRRSNSSSNGAAESNSPHPASFAKVALATAAEPLKLSLPCSAGGQGGGARGSYAAVFSSFLISQYQRWISPLLPRVCRFYPSCSEYSRQCFEKFSWWKAFFLSFRRILRCHPWCKGGFDPVPSLLQRKS